MVKSDSATVTVPELEFEIPAQTQKGVITTVEGLLREAAAGLAALQPERHASQALFSRHPPPPEALPNLAALAGAPEAAAAIDAFLGRLEACCSGTSAFTLELEDPAGVLALLGRQLGLQVPCVAPGLHTCTSPRPCTGNSYVESPDGDVQADGLLRVRPLLCTQSLAPARAARQPASSMCASLGRGVPCSSRHNAAASAW